MPHRTAREGNRVLVCAPYGRDAQNSADLLIAEGYEAEVCVLLEELPNFIDDRTGAILLTEEALSGNSEKFRHALRVQPTWSDIPIVLLAARPSAPYATKDLARLRLGDVAANVITLERPLGSLSLVSAVASALRARQKQLEVRDRLLELAASREELRASRDRLERESHSLEILNRIGARIAGEFDLDQLVQLVVDGGVDLSGAQFGAFFYNVVAEEGESYTLYTLSGAPRAAFEKFPMPRNTKVFDPTFKGVGIIRSNDITQDPRYGQNLPYKGMPEGHLAVRSYLATPVKSRSGEVLGGLFFGHASSGVFSERAERLISGLAGQAAIGIDNARLLRTSQRLNETLERRVRERTDALNVEMETRAKTEAALRQSQKMEAVGQLTGGIAHDFNNMLTGVIGAINIIKRRIAAGRLDDLESIMEAATSSAMRAANLTQRLLAFSRRQSLDSKPVDINALIDGLQELIKRSVRESVTLDIRLGADALPAIADANQLENAILNLAINARDAMPSGGTLTIKTSAVDLRDAAHARALDLSSGQYVLIEVADTGVGMTKEILDKVFEPFFTTKPIGQGTGLGLSMVYGFARQSNGQVRIKTNPGRGTSIGLYLPVAKDQKVEADAQPLRAVNSGSGQTVLVVEDDASVRLLVREILGDLGYKTVEAADPQSAIQVLRTTRTIDLMISDVGLPGMNGRQLAEIARQHRSTLPILFVTGYAENAAIRSRFVGTNMSMVMKPFTFEVLAAKVEEILAPS